MDNIILPEFYRSRKIDTQDCVVFDTKCPYDIILVRDFLSKIGMDINFNHLTLSAFGNTVAMKPKNFCTDPFSAFLDMIQTYGGQ